MQGVNQTLTAQGIMDIMDFDYIPFGNAYYEISECSNRPGFECWEQTCGYNATSPPSDCFTGTIVCQHGDTECFGNLAEVCVKNVTNNNPQKYMPFVYCFEALNGVSKSSLDLCGSSLGLSLNTINTCMNGPVGKHLLSAAAKQTADVVNRTFVPYLTVNGQVLLQTYKLLPTVCAAWTGLKPPCCK
eukprot:TRINITY_DN319_c1_g1_i1.p1 TRINITY_DN319_c1_g1~~TRINITY_DN319_c1_g1_i1.p1  ORF type:complete len:187 (+),score=49.71 TRINITY_DN319_c1_g1_i1:151-711(+)